MGGRLVSKERAANVLSAARLSVVSVASRCEPSQELETWLSGYMAAVEVVALGLGVERMVSDVGKTFDSGVCIGAVAVSEVVCASFVSATDTRPTTRVSRLCAVIDGAE